MRLPGIQYDKPVQSLGRQSVGRVLAASDAKVKAVQSALEVPYAVVKDQYDEYRRRQIEIGQETAALGMAAAENAFNRKHLGRYTYSADELPDNLEIAKTRMSVNDDGQQVESVRTDIPAYEVQADLYRDWMTKHLESNASHIPEGHARELWIADQKTNLERNYGAFVANSITQQKKTVQIQRDARFKMAMGEQRFDTARLIVDRMEITPEEKAIYFREIRKDVETNAYKLSHANLDVPAMQSQIGVLLDKNYRANGGELTDDERDTYVTFLRGGINAAQGKSRADEQYDKSMASSDLARMHAVIKKGQTLSPDVVLSLSMRAGKYPSMAGRVKQFNLDYASSTNVLGMIKEGFTFAEMETAANRVMQEAGKDDVDQIAKAQSLIDMVAQSRDLYDSNSALWAEKYLGQELTPMSPQNISETGRERMAMDQMLRQSYGYTSGVFKAAERAAFIEAINNNGVAENMRLAQDMYSAFGPETGVALVELSAKGASKNFLVAGESIMRGNLAAARFIFEGADMARSDPKYTDGYQADLERAVSDAVGTADNGNPDKAAANRQALINVYHYLAKQSGVRSGVFKKGLIEDAYNIVLGNKHHEYKGYQLELPPNMDGDQFERWLLDTPSSYFEDQGYKLGNGWTSKKLQTEIFSGSMQLIAIGPNEYLVVNPANGQAVFDYARGKKNAQPLVYRVDQDRAPRVWKGGSGQSPWSKLSSQIERKRLEQ